jgi:membrane protease YdiL (CAAX protease family)
MSDETRLSDVDDFDVHLESIALPPRPALWPVFVTFGVMLASVFLLQLVAGMALAVWLLANGIAIDQMPARLQQVLEEPLAFMAVGSLMQMVIAAVGMGAAWLARESWSESLGLYRAGLSWRALATVALGSLAPALVGAASAETLMPILDSDLMIARVCAQTSWKTGLLLLLFIVAVPAVTEEIAFRGYIQRRLLKHWPPSAAILLSSALFGILHMTPYTAVNAFAIGLWLGTVAWRTNSVWPGVLCHAFVNAWGISWPVGHALGLCPEEPPSSVTIAAGTVGVVFLGLSLWILFRQMPRAALAGETVDSVE